jgi:hypothetical protein
MEWPKIACRPMSTGKFSPISAGSSSMT